MTRILLWPTYSFPGNIGADSLYIIGRNLIRATPVGQVHWVMVVPDLPSVPVDDLDERPDVQKVRHEMPLNYRLQESAPSESILTRYAGVEGEEPVDAVITMSPARAMNLANAWAQKATESCRQVIVTWDLLVRDDKRGEFVAVRPELIHQAAGSLASDIVVHESPVARKMTLDVARRFLSASAVRHIMDASIDVPQGISVERLLRLTQGVEKRERFSVYYGGRFSVSKRLDDLSEVVDTFYRFGRDVDFVVTTGSLDRAKREKFLTKYPQVELHVGLSQDEAWRVMASCHASLCFSTHELFGMAFWEQMAVGLRVVMLARSWNEDLVPPGYDLLAQTPAQAGAMLRTLYGRWQAGDWADDTDGARYVREHYDADRNLGAMMTSILGAVGDVQATAQAAYERGVAKQLVEIVREVLDGSDLLTLEEFWAAIRKTSRIGVNVIGRRLRWAKSNATLDGLRVARWLGWEDAFVDGVPAIRRKR